MRTFIVIFVGTLLATTALADFTNVGASGAQFLKIGVGSRYQAMGEAAVATANDVYAAYWNPAGLAQIENAAIGFTNVNWILDIDLNYVALAKNFEGVGVFGLSASLLSMDDQEITTFEQQDGTGSSYAASSYAVGVSFARQLTNRFAFGTTFKYVGEKIHKEHSQGFGFDFGTTLYTGFRSLRLGMSIANMGPKLKFSGPDLSVRYDELSGEGANNAVGAELKTTPYDLPMTFRVGMAYDMEMGPNSVLTLAGELKHPNDNMRQGALGAEWSFSERFFLRGGYKFNYEEEGLAVGGGLLTRVAHTTNLVIDYAWQDFGRLQSTQRFSVGFVF
ncbi:MAG TPA: PorV/PorQ family protein [Candidatus Deferrimicrobium sp.]|nr:PorV/PorQ family protein [Candidatus Deferrimicrobium sp.]